uniref:hypothetical protein n=1 Tax=Xenorhabdus bovienii TaxID=40576 RepID=UPI0039BDA484
QTSTHTLCLCAECVQLIGLVNLDPFALARPPVQSDRCALSGNWSHDSNPDRHDKSPLATAIGNKLERE